MLFFIHLTQNYVKKNIFKKNLNFSKYDERRHLNLYRLYHYNICDLTSSQTYYRSYQPCLIILYRIIAGDANHLF